MHLAGFKNCKERKQFNILQIHNALISGRRVHSECLRQRTGAICYCTLSAVMYEPVFDIYPSLYGNKERTGKKRD